MEELKQIGLHYFQNAISPEEEQELISFIDNQPWNTALSRRTQHYGYLYKYRDQKVSDYTVKPVPQILLDLFLKIKELGICLGLQDTDKLQIIVNEYQCGQGIGKHIDDPKQFGDWIAGVSLGSNINMLFGQSEVPIHRRSVYQMTDKVRYQLTHSIPLRKSDNGVKRNRRISITFRYVLNN